METQQHIIKLDPSQVRDLKDFVRREIRGERAAVSTPLDGWVEITSVAESGQRRVFIPGTTAGPVVRTAQIELERLHEGVRDLLRDLPEVVPIPSVYEQIARRLQEMLK